MTSFLMFSLKTNKNHSFSPNFFVSQWTKLKFGQNFSLIFNLKLTITFGSSSSKANSVTFARALVLVGSKLYEKISRTFVLNMTKSTTQHFQKVTVKRSCAYIRMHSNWSECQELVHPYTFNTLL